MKLPYVYASCCRVVLLSGGYNDYLHPSPDFLCLVYHVTWKIMQREAALTVTLRECEELVSIGNDDNIIGKT
jgi:hypothetical protein